MFKTLKNAWKVQEIQNKILFTLLIILLYRVGSAIPVPYVQPDILSQFNQAYGGTIFSYMSLLSGGAMAQATLFALSVSPYITSSIVIQLLTVAFPDSLGKLAKDGEEGQKKIKKYTRYITVGIALVTAYGYTALLGNGTGSSSWLNPEHIKWSGMWATNGFEGTLNTLVIISSYVAGAAIIMWLAELIDAKGIGNGISMILFFNIISRGPALVESLWRMVTSNNIIVGILLGILSIAITMGMVILVVWVTHSERRIPIQYAKRVVGRKMYGGQGTHLPIKLNMTGVMPIIFASSIVSVPATIATFFATDSGFRTWVTRWLGQDSVLYFVIYVILIVAFAYFYILISFNPVEVANNIKNNGGSVPGIRTGKPTADYITKILNRITLIGAFFLIVVAGLPMIINLINVHVIKGVTFQGLAFGGSSLLIVIGVAIETFRDIEAQITLRHYKGFLD